MTSLEGIPKRVYPKLPTLPALAPDFLLWEHMGVGVEGSGEQGPESNHHAHQCKSSQGLATIKCGTWRTCQAASSNKDRYSPPIVSATLIEHLLSAACCGDNLAGLQAPRQGMIMECGQGAVGPQPRPGALTLPGR